MFVTIRCSNAPLKRFRCRLLSFKASRCRLFVGRQTAREAFLHTSGWGRHKMANEWAEELTKGVSDNIVDQICTLFVDGEQVALDVTKEEFASLKDGQELVGDVINGALRLSASSSAQGRGSCSPAR